MIRILKWAGVLGVIALLGVLFVRFMFYQGVLQMNHPDETLYPLKGIDISNHQGKIDWVKLRQEKLSFLIIKATEGADHQDSSFSYYYTNSKQEGYATGGYHFYRLCSNGREQALNFINTVPNDSLDLPPSVDFEFGGNCDTTGLARSAVIREIQECLDLLEKHYGKRPVIYSTRAFYRAYLVDNFKEYPLWIRSLYRSPFFREKRSWAIWQYANRGHVKGINTFVDLNVINGRSVRSLEDPVDNNVTQP